MENGVIPERVALVLSLVTMWISLTAQIKRWHDMDKSGSWCFVNLVPLIGPLYAIIELGFQHGTKGFNGFGADPLAQQHE